VGKRLVITEKPSVARDLCAVLGGFEDHGEYHEREDLVVTFALGHLLELAEPEDYDKSLRAWTIQSLPIIPSDYRIKPKEGQKKRLDLIRKLGHGKGVDGVINACDAGREGEVIFRRISEFCELDGLPQQRLWLQSMTPDAIRTAFAALRPGHDLDSLADAAWLRGVGDWLIGMNSTRALTRRLKGRREKGSWSAGRVQTPTLGLMVMKEREILAHEPRAYWEIAATFANADQTWTGRFHDPSDAGEDKEQRAGRIFDPARVREVEAAAQAAKTAPASEKRRKSKQNPPLPFDLTSLQREANRKFSFSAKRTLNAAQRLYEAHKLLTYPRTDSRHLPEDWRETLDVVLQALSVDADHTAVASTVIADGPQNLEVVLDNKKVSDHFAIVPTGAEPPADLSGDDARIYHLVVRQFLASLMGPATWAVVERIVDVPLGAGSVAFRTTARSLEVPGFLASLGQEEGAGTQLPPLVPGQDVVSGVPVQVTGVETEEKETRPPSRLTEATLLRLMETAGERIEDEELAEVMAGRGLGTPATRADTIERLISTGYVVRVEGKLAPTPKGMRLMDILERANVPVLASAQLTGEWEHRLKQVEDGAMGRAEGLAGMEQFTREVTTALAGFDYDGLYASEPSLGTCPSCGLGQVVESPWGYRCQRNTNDEDGACRFFLWKERSGRYVDRTLATKLVRDRRADKVTGFIDRFGRALEGRIVLEPESPEPGSQWTMKVEFGAGSDTSTEETPVGVVFPCPCGDAECQGVVETNVRFICQRLLDGLAKAGPVLPRVVCGRSMELEEVEPYFSAEAHTGFIEGFISKRNRPFKGRLVRRPTGRHGFEFPEREGGPPRGRKGAGDDVDKADAAAPKRGGKRAAADAAPKKAAPKKGSAKKASADAAPTKAAGAEAAPKKGSAEKASADAAPTKAAGAEAAPKKASAKKAAGAEASAKKASAKKATGAEAAPKKAAAKKPVVKKAAPKRSGAKEPAAEAEG
jgi:DNA topoisomerase-3